ncbi:MAG: carboxypeptidase regulatory-like domain-containing protein [Candidatus Cloacimonadaceae bacterium]|nr:carboxypeptidase regulatory-like domain-containing protein [Candidatus Cloacimonadota bacterium]
MKHPLLISILLLLCAGTLSLSGTVTPGDSPLRSANGAYSTSFSPMEMQSLSASRHGNDKTSHDVKNLKVIENIQNSGRGNLPLVAVTGRIVGSDAPAVGIEGASIILSGSETYEAVTDASGLFSIPSVTTGQTYSYNATANGYAAASGEVVVGSAPVNMGDIVVNELSYPPRSVVATQSADSQSVTLNWEEPAAGGEWIHYDSGENVDGIGTGAAANFDVAVRYPPSALTGYAGMSLHALRVWPVQAGTFTLKVWTGGTATAPGTLVVQQAFTPVVDTYNMIVLDNPVMITGTQELWFGYNCNVSTGHPAGCDGGPAIDGFGNMMFFNGVWDTLLGIAPTLNYNWNIQGYVGYSAPDRGELIPLNASVNHNATNPERALVGYKVYRLLAADQANEASWTTLTTNTITPLQYVDNAWGSLPSGVYKYAVKAVYSNNVMSSAAFSNELSIGMMGTVSGTVTEFGTNLPIEGATITAGEYNTITNAIGVYNFEVYAGTYEITASKAQYQTATEANVVIQGTQTTTLDFVLTEITLPPATVQAEEAGANVNVTWMEPGAGGGEWIHYDSGENHDSIGTNSAANFDVAVRYPPSALTEFAGMSLHALKVWPAQAGTFTVKVWTGGTAAAPGVLATQQAFTPVLDTYNTVVLDNPVMITGNEELWFGYNCNVTGGFPAGCDAGPAIDGFGNMMYFNNTWNTLLQLGATLNYNWNIQGYVGYGAPDREGLMPLTTKLDQEAHNAERALDGYKVWRLSQGQESNEALWTNLTVNPISATAYQDTAWDTMSDGTYKWAVKAVYPGGTLSAPAFSNAIERITEIGTVAGFVRNMDNEPISGATITSGSYSATSIANGTYSMLVPAGTHSFVASHPSYSSVTQTDIVVVTGQTSTVNFQLPPSAIVLEDDFEAYADFATSFDPWILLDVDQSTTYGFSGITFPGMGATMSYIVFNPNTTIPPIEDSGQAHGGDKYAASFASTTPMNNDWMMTPQIPGGGELSFWARTYMDYGLERFNVGVSATGTNPNNFTMLNGANYVEAPLEWTEYVYDLSAYANQQIHVGIQCVSNDCFIFMVDDVRITAAVANQDGVAPVYTTALKGNYPNPFNPETNISFSMKDAGPVSIEIYNVKGQLVRKLVNDVREAGDHTVVWNGKDNNDRAVSSGIYYFKMNTGKYSSTKKMIMMK